MSAPASDSLDGTADAPSLRFERVTKRYPGADEPAVHELDLEVATELGQRIAATLGRPYDLAGKTIRSSASVGVAVHKAADETADALLLRADQALYRAKASGPGQCVAHDAALEAVRA